MSSSKSSKRHRTPTPSVEEANNGHDDAMEPKRYKTNGEAGTAGTITNDAGASSSASGKKTLWMTARADPAPEPAESRTDSIPPHPKK